MADANESAVSPVVGVMLMLVVVIIIAAVVSGFAGSLFNGNNQKTPSLSMDTQIVNTGYWESSFFRADVTGVDKPIRTKDLKIITSWSKTLANGTTITGGATMIPGVLNFNVTYKVNGWSAEDTWTDVCPQGYGPGVGLNGTENTNFWPFEGSSSNCAGGTCHMSDMWAGRLTNYSWFGNYDLKSGTVMFARPTGGSLGGQALGSGGFKVGYGMTAAGMTGGGQFQYSYGNDAGNAIFYPYPASVDQMEAVLGNNWNLLRAGDIVNMKVIYTPNGRTIWQKNIGVKGG